MRFILKFSHVVMVSILIFTAQLSVASDSAMSREHAIAIAKQQHAGKVLKAQLKENNSGNYYAIKILTPQGRIKVIKVNAQNGYPSRSNKKSQKSRQIKKERFIKKEKFKR